MLNNIGKKVAALVVVMGVVSILLGGFFVQQGFAKANMLSDRMDAAKITYGAAGSTIDGIIDTPVEAQAMADTLTEHQAALGNYAEMKRDDPNRQTYLNAQTMITSLELAVTGFGLTDVVKASGAFMVLTGVTFLAIGGTGLLRRKQSLPQ
jgi:hypothetical protein